MRPNILINVYYSFGGGGIESMISNLSNEARRLGIQSHLIIIGNELGRVNIKEYDNISLIDGKLTGKALAKKVTEQCNYISNNPNDRKILIHTPGLWAVFLKLKNMEFMIHSIPTLINTQTGFAAFVRKKLLGVLYRSHPIIAVSKGIAEDLIKQFHVSKQRIRVVYNGIDYAKLSELSQQPANIPNLPYIVCVARLNPIKQQTHLLKAIAMLESKPDVLFLGTGDEEYLQSLECLSSQLGLRKKVYFLGHINNPYPYIKYAQLLVLCSKTEAMGMVLLEALLLDTPVVSYRSPTGPMEILSENNADSLVELDNIADLAKAIERELHHRSLIDINYYQERYSIQKTLENLMG